MANQCHEVVKTVYEKVMHKKNLSKKERFRNEELSNGR
jgi:hypothetical protein